MQNLIGIYGRLSRDEKGERYASLEVQVQYVRQFVQERALGLVVNCYLDDDVTGVVFEREGLAQLLEDIAAHRVNTVVVKDLSRLGRSNAKTLTLLEMFEEQNVRIVAVDDNWDSFADDDDIIGIKTWYNERYVKDISRKIRSNIHQKLKTGEYLGTPPYGYRKEHNVVNGKLIPINRLLVDEQVRTAVEEIFRLYLEGYGYKRIAVRLEEKGYPTPSSHKDYRRPQSYSWTRDHIRRIISNRVYCGDTVQGVSEKISYKAKKTRRLPLQEWYVSENTHEPIVSRGVWEAANSLRISKRRGMNAEAAKEEAPFLARPGKRLFSGFLVCGSCKAPLCARTRPNRPSGYACRNYLRRGRQEGGCESHFVREDDLHSLVLRNMIEALGETARLEGMRLYSEKSAAAGGTDREIAGLNKEINKISRRLELMYEDRLNGVLPVNTFLEKRLQSERCLTELRERLANLRSGNLSLLPDQDEVWGRLWASGTLTRDLLEICLDKIYVCRPGDRPNELSEFPEAAAALTRQGGIFVAYKFNL